MDNDSLGDACDPDTDGDTVNECLTGQNPLVDNCDCDDMNPNVYTGQTETPGNGIDDDCDPSTPDSLCSIRFDMPGYDAWLPTDGATPSATAVVMENGVDNTSIPISFSVGPGDITNYAGKYTNDESTVLSDDVTYTFNNRTINFTFHDYAGWIKITADADCDLDNDSVYETHTTNYFILPSDEDEDKLADAWEITYGNLNNSDDSESGNYTGDGLTNLEEFRGFKWGRTTLSSNPNYKTLAYVPDHTVTHFRTGPDYKDLFVKFTGFDDTTTDKPFAIGSAFINANVRVHALDSLLTTGIGENNIDVLLVTNDLVNTYGLTDGYINRRSGVRDWSWDTKGQCSTGSANAYGSNCITFQVPLDHYFGDKPYRDGGGCISANGVLDIIDDVEDGNDNGVTNGNEARRICKNGILDGDLYIPGSFSQDLSAFDYDNDFKIELPIASDPTTIDTNYEYTKMQVLKHTITHEIGHGIGMSHNSDSTCLMYQYTTDWRRDETFSSTAKNQIQIHNN
jgi:hypothetical protein